MAAILARHSYRKNLSLVWIFIFMVVIFNLNKWEMLTNGTGWVHFWAMALFFYHYDIYDYIAQRQERRFDRVKLICLPIIITFLVAGPYSIVYLVNLTIFYLLTVLMLNEKKKENKKNGNNLKIIYEYQKKRSYWFVGCITVTGSLFLYLLSSAYAIEDHAGAVDIGVFEAIFQDITFFPKFIIKSFASAIVGVESIWNLGSRGILSIEMIYGIGLLVIVGYLLAGYLLIKLEIMKISILPGLLLLSGIGNHLIVFLSRYIFLNDDYGMSSRYALQYQVGILGILLTFAFAWKKLEFRWEKFIILLFTTILLCGQFYTNYDELNKAKYRKENFDKMEEIALNFEEHSDEILRENFDYRKSQENSGALIRNALTILKENQWNVFSN